MNYTAYGNSTCSLFGAWFKVHDSSRLFWFSLSLWSIYPPRASSSLEWKKKHVHTASRICRSSAVMWSRPAGSSVWVSREAHAAGPTSRCDAHPTVVVLPESAPELPVVEVTQLTRKDDYMQPFRSDEFLHIWLRHWLVACPHPVLRLQPHCVRLMKRPRPCHRLRFCRRMAAFTRACRASMCSQSRGSRFKPLGCPGSTTFCALVYWNALPQTLSTKPFRGTRLCKWLQH